MKIETTKTGILVNGSIRSAGVTFYSKLGRTVVRSSVTRQPLRRTLKQFNARQRRIHATSLWRDMRFGGEPLLTYREFCALAAKLPALYLTRDEHAAGATLLMPGIPVSYGTLPDIRCRLGTLDGAPALLTDLQPASLDGADRLLLVTLRQLLLGSTPRLQLLRHEVALADCVLADSGLALTGERFGDNDCGWALVRRRGMQCSTQTVVTRSTRYRAYLTDDALRRSAASYGGLT